MCRHACGSPPSAAEAIIATHRGASSADDTVEPALSGTQQEAYASEVARWAALEALLALGHPSDSPLSAPATRRCASRCRVFSTSSQIALATP